MFGQKCLKMSIFQAKLLLIWLFKIIRLIRKVNVLQYQRKSQKNPQNNFLKDEIMLQFMFSYFFTWKI